MPVYRNGRTNRVAEDNRSDVIVIGAGFGGLAAAIRLAAQGKKVRVLESRSIPGGRAGQIRDCGFTFDTGPTLITAPELLEDLWATAGRSIDEYVDIRPLEPFYRIMFKDDSYFDYSGDIPTLEAQIEKFNPSDVAGYRRFLQSSAEIYRRAFVDLGRVSFHRLQSFLKVIPNLVRLGGLRSVYDYVSRFIADPHLRTVFSFHPLFIGGNPFRASAIYSIVPYLERQGGVHFAMGGMFSLVKAMVRLLEELGGEIVLNTPVRSIASSGGHVSGVQTQDGRFWSADIVVANSDAATTLLDLVSPPDRSRIWSQRWKRASYSMSCFLLYIGLDRQYPELKHHTIVMPKDFRRVVTQIFDDGQIPSDIPMYIHTPTRTDPSMAPDGGESMYILVPVPNLASDIDWNIAGDRLRAEIVNYIENDLDLSGFSEAIQVEHRFTPVDFRDELGSWLGAAFSIEPTLSQSAWLRPPNQSREVKGLYFVGAGTHPGAGVPGVLLSAEITADLVRNMTHSNRKPEMAGTAR